MSRAMRTALSWSAREFGVNGAALNATTNSNVIPLDGCNQIVMDVTITNVTGAAIRFVGYPQTRQHGETVWKSLLTKSVAGGVETCSIREINYTTLPNPGTYAFEYDTSIAALEGTEFRLAGVTDDAGGAGATDLVSIKIRVGHTGA